MATTPVSTSPAVYPASQEARELVATARGALDALSPDVLSQLERALASAQNHLRPHLVTQVIERLTGNPHPDGSETFGTTPIGAEDIHAIIGYFDLRLENGDIDKNSRDRFVAQVLGELRYLDSKGLVDVEGDPADGPDSPGAFGRIAKWDELTRLARNARGAAGSVTSRGHEHWAAAWRHNGVINAQASALAGADPAGLPAGEHPDVSSESSSGAIVERIQEMEALLSGVTELLQTAQADDGRISVWEINSMFHGLHRAHRNGTISSAQLGVLRASLEEALNTAVESEESRAQFGISPAVADFIRSLVTSDGESQAELAQALMADNVLSMADVGTLWASVWRDREASWEEVDAIASSLQRGVADGTITESQYAQAVNRLNTWSKGKAIGGQPVAGFDIFGRRDQAELVVNALDAAAPADDQTFVAALGEAFRAAALDGRISANEIEAVYGWIDRQALGGRGAASADSLRRAFEAELAAQVGGSFSSSWRLELSPGVHGFVAALSVWQERGGTAAPPQPSSYARVDDFPAELWLARINGGIAPGGSVAPNDDDGSESNHDAPDHPSDMFLRAWANQPNATEEELELIRRVYLEHVEREEQVRAQQLSQGDEAPVAPPEDAETAPTIDAAAPGQAQLDLQRQREEFQRYFALAEELRLLRLRRVEEIGAAGAG